MLRRKKFTYFRILKQTAFNAMYKKRFSFAHFKRDFKVTSDRKIFLHVWESLNSQVFSNTKQFNLISPHSNTLNYKYPRYNVFYTDLFQKKGVDTSFQRAEVYITRVRFRPGYQRL